jgi:hypothetical protein
VANYWAHIEVVNFLIQLNCAGNIFSSRMINIKQISSLPQKLEQIPKSLVGLGCLFVLIVMTRNILEAISSPRPDGQWPDGITFFFHYPLAYLATILLIIIMLTSNTKESIGQLPN